MQSKKFNIRSVDNANQVSGKRVAPNNEIPAPNPTYQANNIEQFISFFSSMMQSKGFAKSFSKPQQVEARDRQVQIPLPQIVGDKIKESDLKYWVSDMFKNITSTAFHFFSKNQMSFDQAKIYCSENIFKNFVALSQRYNLSAEQMEIIDDHIKNGVINYLAAKYPLTDSTDINKKLEQAVRSVDIIESVENNYFTNSSIVFTYRDSLNYNDLIMQLLNDAMKKVDQPNKGGKTNYEEFQGFMSNIFEKVEDEDWMNQQPSQNKSEADKEKYKAKVKQYTHYLIGRKIHENTPQFSQSDIKNGNIDIKSPQILRILTKWCQQLQDKFKDYYFTNRAESFKMQKAEDIIIFKRQQKIFLDQKLSRSLEYIQSELDDVKKNNFEMQVNLLQNQLQIPGDQHIDFREKISGKFSVKVVQNLHEYLITYLNNLIHYILEASQTLFDTYTKVYGLEKEQWESPPNLLSFKIGDLMRCKCSSKQKEILRIYEEINRVSKENPEKLKIVRIKNRLRSGTNDILMNVRFNNTILCEIQLAIHSKTSDFIKCSNMFHHYLYELQRSTFGPITQLCSIWNSLDRRCSLYQQLVKEQQAKLKRQPKKHACLKLKNDFKMQVYYQPFICSNCHLTFYHNRFIISHKKCSMCPYYVCASCSLSKQDKKKKMNLLGRELGRNCGKIISYQDQLPKFGACILIQSKTVKVQLFNVHEYQNKQYILGRQNGKIYSIFDIKSKIHEQSFKKKYIIFQIFNHQNTPSEKIKQARIDPKQVTKSHILPLMIKQDLKKQKQRISFSDKIETEKCQELLSIGTLAQKENIRNIFVPDNQNMFLPLNPSEYLNLEWLILSRNPIKSLKGIQNFSKLRILQVNYCFFPDFPAQIYACQKLQKLNISGNKGIKLDGNIGNLRELQVLNIQKTLLDRLPKEIKNCKQIKELNLSGNGMSSIEGDIGLLTKLQILNLEANNFSTLNITIENLPELKKFNVNHNQILKSLPSGFKKIRKIQDFNIQHTMISDIPMPQQGWQNLKKLRIQNSMVKNLPKPLSKSTQLQVITSQQSINNVNFQSLPLIEKLKFEHCDITGSPKWLFTLRSINGIHLTDNKITDIKSMFFDTPYLYEIDLSYNNITEFPDLSGCSNLQKINFSYNSIGSVPPEYLENLSRLSELNMESNKLTCLPDSLQGLPVGLLNFSDNQLTCIFSPQFDSSSLLGTDLWPELNTINFKNNKLEEIPLFFCGVKYLKELNFEGNRLKKIPPKIKMNEMLTHIYLGSNSITEIPKELSQLPELQALCLQNNKIQKIPIFMQSLSMLKLFTVSAEHVKKIQCIEWILENQSIQFGELAKLAEELRSVKPNIPGKASIKKN